MMPGPAHHQGSLTLDAYGQRWVRQSICFIFVNAQSKINYYCFFANVCPLCILQSASHGGRPCPQLKAYALAHKGKATADIDYSSEDPTSAYSNAVAHSRLSSYSEMAREVHGPDFDPINEPIDGVVVMRAGGGKKHGRYMVADSALQEASIPSLPVIRARSTSADPSIRQRPTAQQLKITALEVLFYSIHVTLKFLYIGIYCYIGNIVGATGGREEVPTGVRGAKFADDAAMA